MRFAALKPFLQRAFRSRVGQAVLPQTGAELVGSLAPNVLFAGMTALNQPEGTSAGLAFGAGAEDLAGSLVLQTLGRGLGFGFNRGAGLARGGQMLDPGWQGALTSAAEVGTEWLGYPLTPRPFATQAYDEYAARMEEEQRRQQAARDQAIREQAIAQAGGFGSLLPPAAQEALFGGYG